MCPHNNKETCTHMYAHTHTTLSQYSDRCTSSQLRHSWNKSKLHLYSPSESSASPKSTQVQKSKAPQFKFCQIKLTQIQLTDMVQVFHLKTLDKRDKKNNNKYK